jgi:hypothetical protein
MLPRLGLAAVVTVLLAAVAGGVPAYAGTTSVESGTRIIDLNGQPMVIKGYVYQPTPIGGDQEQAFADPSPCQRDAALMAPAGVTVVRVFLQLDEAADLSQLQQCAQHFADAGIGIAWVIPILPLNTPDFVTAEEQAADQFVGGLKGSSATDFWLLGNEIERTDTQDTNGDLEFWFGTKGGATGALDALAQHLHNEDSAHLVGTTLTTGSCVNRIGTANDPHLDFWAFNAYPGRQFSGLCGGNFWTWLDNVDPRPKWISEFGVDRFKCLPPTLDGITLTIGSSVNTCETNNGSYATSSHEDQQAQADWDTSLWNDLSPHIATSSNPQGSVSGGTVFSYSDGWDGCALCADNLQHDVTGAIGTTAQPDGVENWEWWGVAYAQMPAATEPRPTSLTFDALARLWAVTPPPQITSGPTVTATPTCTSATLNWTTSEPTTGAVYASIDGEILDQGGGMLVDDTVPQAVASDSTAATTHSLTFTVPPAANGTSPKWKAIARSYTSDGRTATSAPIRFHC